VTAAKRELVIPIRVSKSRGNEYAAATEFAGTPICSYGPTEDEATRRAKSAILRLLGNLLERGTADVEALRFKTTSG
jgi:hypothetical protein